MRQMYVDLSAESIDKAISEVKRVEKIMKEKANILAKKLADIGLQEASVRFATAAYSGVNDVQVRIVPTAKGYAVIAEGEAVCFIEFGAGVYYNGAEPYPDGDRPAGIVGIGEFGQGKGKQSAWGYYDDTGNLVITRGTPAAMPLWYAKEEIVKQVEKVVKEVLSID